MKDHCPRLSFGRFSTCASENDTKSRGSAATLHKRGDSNDQRSRVNVSGPVDVSPSLYLCLHLPFLMSRIPICVKGTRRGLIAGPEFILTDPVPDSRARKWSPPLQNYIDCVGTEVSGPCAPSFFLFFETRCVRHQSFFH